MSFVGPEIDRLQEFLGNLKLIHFKDDGKLNVRRRDLRLVEANDVETRRILQDNPQLIAQLARSEVTEQDIVAPAFLASRSRMHATMSRAIPSTVA